MADWHQGLTDVDFIVPLFVYGVPPCSDIRYRNVGGAPQQSPQGIDHYRSVYGLSLERMLAESPVDRDEVLRLRDSSKSGEMAAVRYVMKWNPVPLEIAIQFVRAL